MPSAEFDLFIIGGGINGCGIARDAAGRGFSVCLAEMNDLASGTSSWSSKLIHGGFRYLEYYEFRLVREALSEREILWALAPHIIRPMRFVLPHHKGMRPAWLLRLGLFLYDHIGARKLLPATRSLDLRKEKVGVPLKAEYTKGFEYSDCWVDDARLVVLNAQDAAARGAEIHVGTKCVGATRENGIWKLNLVNVKSGVKIQVSAKMVINAAGPWVDDVLARAFGYKDPANVRLVKGSHIVVPKLHDHDRAYIFQNKDGRIVFAIPWQDEYTVIGTTDMDYHGDPAKVVISQEEQKYLCEIASEYFTRPILEKDIVWTYSGVRPLYDDGASEAQEATRDYVLRLNEERATGEPPIANIFGGKITTYRRLAESMMEMVEDQIGRKGRPWTSKPKLPGGDFPPTSFGQLVDALTADYPWLEGATTKRLAHQFGKNSWLVLGNAKSLSDLGQDFGHGLHEAEVRYMAVNEWARCADDVLWRRTKLGMKFSAKQVNALQQFMDAEL
jgi:glycerol-3-phosphate dehydrogenase